MDPSRVDRILDQWLAVAETGRPAAPARRVMVRTAISGLAVTVAGLAIVALAVVAFVRINPGPTGGGIPPAPVGTDTSVIASPTSSAGPTAPAASGSPVGASPGTPSPGAESAAPSPDVPVCTVDRLSARITRWEGAAGHRIADVELANTSTVACRLPETVRPQLVAGQGTILTDGTPRREGGSLVLTSGGVVTTLVDTDNYCGPAPVAPVSVAFVFDPGGRLVATPVSARDATVPPCLGAPGSAGSIQMHAWAP